MRFITAFVLAVLTSVSAQAESKAPTKPADMSGIYLLDKNHASVLFTVRHLGYSNYTGRFDQMDAQLIYDAKNPAKSTLTATLAPASIDTNNKELENKLRSEAYFNAVKFPEVSFIATDLKLRDRKNGTLTGNLTMLGVTKPVKLNVTINKVGHNDYNNEDALGISANCTIKRSDWGMKTLVPQVSDEVKVIIEAEFFRKKQSAQ